EWWGQSSELIHTETASRLRGRIQTVIEAAQALAKLYKSNANAAKAQAVLQPALEGFWPTPDVPEIAEARALLEGSATDSIAHGAQWRRRSACRKQLRQSPLPGRV